MIRTLAALLVVVVGLGCGGDKREPPRAKAAPSDAAVASADAASAAPGPAPIAAAAFTDPIAPATIAALVPADAEIAFATIAPLPVELWDRLGADLPVFLASLARMAPDPPASPVIEQRLVEALAFEVGGKASRAALGLPASPRFLAHRRRGATTIAVELAKPAVTRALVARVVERSGLARTGGRDHHIVTLGGRSWAIAVRGSWLVIVDTPAGGVTAALLDPPPVARGDLVAIAARHGNASGVGVIDIPTVVASLPEESRHCLESLLEGFSPTGLVELWTAGASASGVDVRAGVPLAPALIAEINAKRARIPGLTRDPVKPPPLLTIGFMSGGLKERWAERLVAACGDAPAEIDPPWDKLEGGVAAIYDVSFGGILPSNIQGFVAVAAPGTGAVEAELRKFFGGQAAAFLAKPIDFARAGNITTAAFGATGKRELAAARAAATGPSPLFLLAVDLGWLSKLGDTKVVDVFDEAGLQEVQRRLFGSIRSMLDAGAGGLELSFEAGFAPAPSLPMEARKPDAASRKRAACRAYLGRRWTAALPGLEAIGAPRDGEAYKNYLGGPWASGFFDDCTSWNDAQRRCLLRWTDPFGALAACGVGTDAKGFDIHLPDVIDRFGDDSYEDSLRRPLDDAGRRAARAQLAGTWVRTDDDGKLDTWTIDAKGSATHVENGETTRGKLELERENHLLFREPDGSGSYYTYHRIGDRLVIGGGDSILRRRSPDDFVAHSGSPYVGFRRGACTIVDDSGAWTTGTCRFETSGKLQLFHATGTLLDREIDETWVVDGEVLITKRAFEHDIYDRR